MDRLNNQIEQSRVMARLTAIMEIEKECLKNRMVSEEELQNRKAEYETITKKEKAND